MSEQVNGVYRLVTIDGPRVVCTDSTGDLPLFQITIDETLCRSFEEIAGPLEAIVSMPALAPRDVPIAPVPELSTLALMAAGFLVIFSLYKRGEQTVPLRRIAMTAASPAGTRPPDTTRSNP